MSYATAHGLLAVHPISKPTTKLNESKLQPNPLLSPTIAIQKWPELNLLILETIAK